MLRALQITSLAFLATTAFSSAAATPAQQASQEAESCRPKSWFALPSYRSAEQLPDGRVTFRLCAPEAEAVSVLSVDVEPAHFGAGDSGLAMTKSPSGLWTATSSAAVVPGTHRFNFRIDGVKVPDPAGTTYVEDRVGVNSVFEADGPDAAFQRYDKDVPHGAVSEIVYWSSTLGAPRRAHIYTPPGYMKGRGTFPVLYLVHGAGDSDAAWTGTGHAHYILDNLIAAGKAKPMIVVMPAGHTPERASGSLLTNRDFGDDLVKDLIPYVAANYRTKEDPGSRAMAGLSMGGAHTLRFGLTRPDLFRYVGVFSMGLGLEGGDRDRTTFEQAHGAALNRAAREMKVVYYAMGKDDFLYPTVASTRAMLNKHGIKHLYRETGGGHTWSNWRRYLQDFAPLLFR